MAKHRGKSGGTRSDPVTEAGAFQDLSTLDTVKKAVEDRNTVLAFQPVVHARAPDNAAFYEALIRVRDPSGRIIPARDFMPIIENSALGRDIDCAALDMALRTLERNPRIHLSVNMSARSVGYMNWMRILEDALRVKPQLGNRLILEITENSAMTVPELVIDFMARLRISGVKFALDDFGAGHSAFRYFRDFSFHAVKIDGQFIRGISNNTDNQALTCALVSIAKQFEMTTIAESVETQQDAAFLAEIGVECLQGYAFAPPTLKHPWRKSGNNASAA